MSKNSAKQRYTQLMEWLGTFNQGKPSTPGVKRQPQRFSKMDLYKNKR